MRSNIFIVVILFYLSNPAISQEITSGLELIGKPVPPFKFKNVMNYKSVELSSTELHGKPFIVDFWPTWCTPCIAALPRLDSLQVKMGSKIQILPVSYDNE